MNWQLKCALILMLQFKLILTQDCLQPASGIQIPVEDIGGPRLPSGTQAIVTSYQFNCCGDITAWEAAVNPDGRDNQEVVAQSEAQNCLLSDSGNINFNDLGGRGASDRLPTGSQAIITSYQFSCCGRVTRWQTYMEPGGGGHDEDYSVTFQVWRPSPSVELDGCYSLVEDDAYTNIPLGDNGLVTRDVPSSTVMSVQPGDVVGYFITSTRGDGRDEGIQLERRNNNEGERVWYRSSPLIGSAGQCPFPVGEGRTLGSSTNAAPVFSIDIAISASCPTPTSSTPPTFPPSTSTAASPSPTPTPTPSPTPNPSPTPTPSPTPNPSPTPTPILIPNTMGTDGITTTDEGTPDLQPPTTAPLNDITTSRIISPSGVPDEESNIGIIVGVVVTLVLLMLIITVVVILTIVLLKKRMRSIKLEASTVSNFANPNYESSSTPSFLITKHHKGKKKAGSKPAPITLDITETAMYETLDVDDPLDYTYPKPSPTAKYNPDANTYAYIPTMREEGKMSEEGDGLYHAIGPNAIGNGVKNGRRTAAPSAPPPVPSRNGNGHSPPFGSKNVYHLLEGAGASIHYEDPTLPQFRESMKNKDAMFESIGSYVPTQEQRQMFASNYEQQDEDNKQYNRLHFFVEDQIYWAPATTTSDLYAQLASKKYREIHRNQIKILEKLGSGQFGEVCKGLWTVGGQTRQLAVKTLIPGASEDDKLKFLQEAAIMGQFSHPNVIRLHGVVTVGEPVMVCSELLKNGDLRSYLQAIDLSKAANKDVMEMHILFLKFARDIAAGMSYLSQKSFIHRDLAARNVLLDDSLTSKIGDFGMARDLMDDTYYKSSGGKIPVKWTAPEALLYKRYSPDSDVWSYGMVLFEIWSVAKKPFSTISNNQVLRLIQTGFCQAPPPGCPRAIYELMVHCWHPEHEQRPSFKDICSQHLQQSSARMLYWNTDDNRLSPQVEVLGAPLEQAFKLHLDLQEKYTAK